MPLLRFLGISGSHPFIEGEHMLKYLNEQLLLEISLKTNRFKIFVRVSFLLQFLVCFAAGYYYFKIFKQGMDLCKILP